jgi:hypothetical protein
VTLKGIIQVMQVVIEVREKSIREASLKVYKVINATCSISYH